MSTTMARDGGAKSEGRRSKGGHDLSGLLTGGRRPLSGQQWPRNRSWGLVTLAALLVVGLGLAVAAWGLHAGQKTSVVSIVHPVTKGHVIDRSDLTSTAVSGVTGAIPVAQVDTVAGQTAAVDLVAGQIVTRSMLTSHPVPDSGQATVGLALDPTRVPGAGLNPGDVVDVIAVPGTNDKADPDAVDNPAVLAKRAEVYDVGGSATTGGQVLVTLVVKGADADRVAAYSTQNRVAIVETPPSGAGGS